MIRSLCILLSDSYQMAYEISKSNTRYFKVDFMLQKHMQPTQTHRVIVLKMSDYLSKAEGWKLQESLVTNQM